MKTICICEKPSVARSIARVLGVTEKQEGYLSGNGYAVRSNWLSVRLKPKMDTRLIRRL